MCAKRIAIWMLAMIFVSVMLFGEFVVELFQQWWWSAKFEWESAGRE
jgi:hypothetical protein